MPGAPAGLALFETAYARTLAWEQPYANDPADPGGETVYGIARRRHPDWLGWRRVEALRTQPGFPRSLGTDVELQRLARAFYATEFWRPLRCDEIAVAAGGELAAKVFDVAVNVGRRRGAEFLQLGLRAAGADLAVDGRIGPGTLGELARTGPEMSLALLRSVQAGYYRGLAAARPSLQRFANGWERRALA